MALGEREDLDFYGDFGLNFFLISDNLISARMGTGTDFKRNRSQPPVWRTSMENVKPYIREIKPKGQLTIPKKIRETGRFEEGQPVAIIPLGDFLLIVPKKLELDEARRQIKKILRNSGLTAEEILAGLKAERETLYEEKYGGKGR